MTKKLMKPSKQLGGMTKGSSSKWLRNWEELRSGTME